MAVKFSDFASSGLNSTGFIVGYDSGTNQNIRIPKSTLDSTYQSTLISGTNIKTINGSSVLGSGDLVVSGGTGGGTHTPFQLASGDVYSNIPIGASNGTASLSTDLILIMPFKPAQTFTTSNIYISVSTLGAGVNARILLYTHSATNGLPDTKIYESADLDCSTTGAKTAITAQTFTAGTTYWLGVHASGGVTFGGVVVSSLIQIGMYASTLAQYTAISRTVAFGSAPSTWGTTATKISSSFPRIGLTIA